MRAVERIAMPIEVRLFETPANSLLRLYAGRRAAIPHQDGGGLIDDFIAQGPRPPAEIHIAEARSELLIKSAVLVRDGRPSPRVQAEERVRWRLKQPNLDRHCDPFYSPHLSTRSEDASLREDDPFPPEDTSRAAW